MWIWFAMVLCSRSVWVAYRSMSMASVCYTYINCANKVDGNPTRNCLWVPGNHAIRPHMMLMTNRWDQCIPAANRSSLPNHLRQFHCEIVQATATTTTTTIAIASQPRKDRLSAMKYYKCKFVGSLRSMLTFSVQHIKVDRSPSRAILSIPLHRFCGCVKRFSDRLQRHIMPPKNGPFLWKFGVCNTHFTKWKQKRLWYTESW